MKDYGKILWDLLPDIIVRGTVFPSQSFGQVGWLIRRGYFHRNVFVYSTEEYDDALLHAKMSRRAVTVSGKVITRAQDNKTLMVLPASVEEYR